MKKFSVGRFRGGGGYTSVVSSTVNQGIRALLNLFIDLFFLQEDFTRTKSTKCIQANKNKKTHHSYAHKNI